MGEHQSYLDPKIGASIVPVRSAQGNYGKMESHGEAGTINKEKTISNHLNIIK